MRGAKPTNESTIVRRFIQRVYDEFGCQTIKLGYRGRGTAGWPDRLILLPNGYVAMIEFKRPGETPRELQRYRIDYLRKNGFDVEVFDDADAAVLWVGKVIRKNEVSHAAGTVEAEPRAEARSQVAS